MKKTIEFMSVAACILAFAHFAYGGESGSQPAPATSPLSAASIPKSTVLAGLTWLGPRVPASGGYKADTFPVTWADDDLLYSAGGDPVSEKRPDGLDVISIQGYPNDFQVTVVNPMPDFTGWGGNGLKPTGMLSRKGVLYLFSQNLGQRTDENAEKCHGYDAQVFKSVDKGKTWEPDINTVKKKPMFPGRDFGSPAFVNYGKDNVGETDAFVYALSGQGWANGDVLKLGRVPADKIMDRAAWEFVGGFDSMRNPLWIRDVGAATPVLQDKGFMGCAECAYISSFKRHLLFDVAIQGRKAR